MASNWNWTLRDVARPIVYEVDENVHACEPMMNENRFRVLNSDTNVYLFKDFDSETWNMRVGLEFVRMSMCPFCGSKL
jgi:hypothetical protein